MIRVALDMETQDPDDVMTLCVLATHPWVELVSVTVHPGSREQVGLIRRIYEMLDEDPPLIGAGTPKKPVSHVSGFHNKWIGKWDPADPDGSAAEILARVADKDVTLITGAALTNVKAAYDLNPEKWFGRWFCQGGFVGDNIMDPEHVLPKFKGRITCPTYNLNGNPEAALFLLSPNDSRRFESRHIVPKSVCHGIVHTLEAQRTLVNLMREHRSGLTHKGLSLAHLGMRLYLDKNHEGKALHDLVAAACAVSLDPPGLELGYWAPVNVFRERGEWGSKPTTDYKNAVFALVRLREDVFYQTIVGISPAYDPENPELTEWP